MIDLKTRPFYLSDEDVRWVEETLGGMTTEEKVGQLFCPMGFSGDPNVLNHIVNELHVGGMMYRTGAKADIWGTYGAIQKMAKIPLLLAANTEAGGNGLCAEGTSFGRPMAVAATGDAENAYRMGYVACAEGAAVGLNWSFAPIVDIDREFHNPITNVRTFGSDVERVIEMGKAYIRGAKDAGVATAVKHFPGDGCDERDQHIVTSINSLSASEWDETYGRIYREMIGADTLTVMVGHIAQPAKVRELNENASKREMLLPATLSPELLTGVLRGQLGFNGLISTDATPMIGYLSAMRREDALPASIMAGCDMILFNKDMDEDYGFMMSAVRDGRLTSARLDEAVTRILAAKAALKLHQKQREGTLIPDERGLDIVGCERHRQWAEQVADQSVTLVKDTQNLLPISPQKYKRVYLNVIQKSMSPEDPLVAEWKALFEKEGCEVTVRDRSTTIEMENFMGINMTEKKAELLHELYRPISEFKAGKDLYVYIANVDNASNNTTTRLNWNVVFGLGDDAPWFAEEIPALFISVANPYHLFDAPMVKTYINSYNSAPAFNRAVMEKIMGRSEFKGVSPVDPFCGNEYIRWMNEEESR